MKTSSSLTLLVGAALLALACHSQSTAQEARNATFECQVAAFAKVIPASLDAAKLVEDLYTGSAKLDAVLNNLELKVPELVRLSSDLTACLPEDSPSKPVAPAAS